MLACRVRLRYHHHVAPGAGDSAISGAPPTAGGPLRFQLHNPASTLARSKTARNISFVSFPVLVFCNEG
jgi:hypothetical protein